MSMQVTATFCGTDLDQHHDDLPQKGPTSTMAPPAGIVRASLSRILSSGSGIHPGISRLYGMTLAVSYLRAKSAKDQFGSSHNNTRAPLLLRRPTAAEDYERHGC